MNNEGRNKDSLISLMEMFKDDLGGNRNQDLINNIENNQERWKDTAQAAYGI